MAVQQCTELSYFRFLVRIPTVSPFDGKAVVGTDVWGDVRYVVLRVGHIVEAGIVHDGRCPDYNT